jgi:hypothetical protein
MDCTVRPFIENDGCGGSFEAARQVDVFHEHVARVHAPPIARV